MVARPVLTEPFESLAIDLVGPFPKGKGGACWVLTTTCMATRWPDAIPLKEVSAKAVVNGLIDFFPHSFTTADPVGPGWPVHWGPDEGALQTSQH